MYAVSQGLTYKIKECEFLIFKGRNRVSYEILLIKLNGLSLKRATKFTYLGVTDDLSDDADMERGRRALPV